MIVVDAGNVAHRNQEIKFVDQGIPNSEPDLNDFQNLMGDFLCPKIGCCISGRIFTKIRSVRIEFLRRPNIANRQTGRQTDRQTPPMIALPHGGGNNTGSGIIHAQITEHEVIVSTLSSCEHVMNNADPLATSTLTSAIRTSAPGSFVADA